MSEELKACPFCGKSDAFVERADFSSCYVMCNDCSARGPCSCDENEVDADATESGDVDPGELPARRLWNTRRAPHPIANAGEAMREALAWYGEQARLARLIHSEGDAGRHALQEDGGKKADAILSLLPSAPEGDAAAMREAAMALLEACTAEFGWAPGEPDTDPAGGDQDCLITHGHLRRLHQALSLLPIAASKGGE